MIASTWTERGEAPRQQGLESSCRSSSRRRWCIARKVWLYEALSYIVLLSLSVSCKNPEGTESQFINPPDKIVGSFALEDETGTILLEFPGSKALSGKGATVKTVQDVTGTLTVSSVRVGYDEQVDVGSERLILRCLV